MGIIKFDCLVHMEDSEVTKVILYIWECVLLIFAAYFVKVCFVQNGVQKRISSHNLQKSGSFGMLGQTLVPLLCFNQLTFLHLTHK